MVTIDDLTTIVDSRLLNSETILPGGWFFDSPPSELAAYPYLRWTVTSGVKEYSSHLQYTQLFYIHFGVYAPVGQAGIDLNALEIFMNEAFASTGAFAAFTGTTLRQTTDYITHIIGNSDTENVLPKMFEARDVFILGMVAEIAVVGGQAGGSATSPGGADQVLVPGPSGTDAPSDHSLLSNLDFTSSGHTGFAPPCTVEVFIVDGVYTMPANAVSVHVAMIGGGAGGASGRQGSSSPLSARGGGGGGGGGAKTVQTFPASVITSPVAVTVGLGGAGGGIQASADNNGNLGQNGGTSTFGTYARAGGGNASLLAGGQVNSTGGTAGSGQFPGTAGATGSAAGTGTNAANGNAGGGGGGGGGGIPSTSNTPGNGGQGAGRPTEFSLGQNTGIGVAPGGIGDPGADAIDNLAIAGGGGAGGAASHTTAAGKGGNGGLYGGGGGGGGGSTNGFASGAGGDGHDGIVVVTTYF